MKIHEITESEKGWFGRAIDYVMHGSKKEDPLLTWVKKNVRQKGTQWIYRNVNKEFPNRYVKSDVRNAIATVLGSAT